MDVSEWWELSYFDLHFDLHLHLHRSPPTDAGRVPAVPVQQLSVHTAGLWSLGALFVGRRGRDSTTDSFRVSVSVSVTGDELSVRSALALALTAAAASRNPRKVSGEPLSQ